MDVDVPVNHRDVIAEVWRFSFSWTYMTGFWIRNERISVCILNMKLALD